VPVYKSYTARFESEDLLQSYMLLGGEPHSGLQQDATVPICARTSLANPGGM